MRRFFRAVFKVISAIWNGLGPRRYFITGIIGIAGVIYAFAREWASTYVGMELPYIPGWVIALLVVAALIFWGMLGRVIAIESAEDPALDTLFEFKQPFVWTLYEAGHDSDPNYELTLVRVLVRPRIPYLSGCRAVLTGIQQMGLDGFGPNMFDDPRTLSWAGRQSGDPYADIELRSGIDQYVDIFDVRRSDPCVSLWVKNVPVVVKHPLRQPGIWRLTIKVSAQGRRASVVKLDLDWKGAWHGWTVKAVGRSQDERYYRAPATVPPFGRGTVGL